MSRKKIEDLPPEYTYDENGFIRQISHHNFDYTQEYKNAQSTNIAMSHLRIGFLSAFLSVEEMAKMNMVDVGCGNGVFADCCKGKFKSVCGYDVAGDSITKDELYTRHWELIVLSDVLEHFEDIEDLFRMNWEYCLLSFPETPDFGTFNELSSWRHFKPNEHLYYLHADGVIKWVETKHRNAFVVAKSCFEDLIRTRWDDEIPNISTLLIKRI